MSTPAFPSTNALATASGVMTQGHPGMTLRDYFATAALPVTFDYCSSISRSAEEAYKIADAMLAAREGGAA